MKTVFITYGDNRYRLKKLILKHQAKKLGFQETYAFGKSDLHHEFIRKCEPFINYKRGGGYWLWKPYIIFRELSKISENDILVYCDAGSIIDFKKKKIFREYIELLQEKHVLAFESGQLNKWYINDKTLKRFNVINDIIFLNNIQVGAGVLIIRKCKDSMELFTEWLNIALYETELFTDNSSINTTRQDFVEHRHDQSVFNIFFYFKNGTSLQSIASGDKANPFITARTTDNKLPIIKYFFSLISLLRKVIYSFRATLW